MSQQLPISLILGHRSPPDPLSQTIPFPGYNAILHPNAALAEKQETPFSTQPLITASSSLCEKNESCTASESLPYLSITPGVRVWQAKSLSTPMHWSHGVLHTLSSMNQSSSSRSSATATISSSTPGNSPSTPYNQSPSTPLTSTASSSMLSSAHHLLPYLQNPSLANSLPPSYINSLFHSIQRYQYAVQGNANPPPSAPPSPYSLFSLHIGQYFNCLVSLCNTSSSTTISNLVIVLECFTTKSTSGNGRAAPTGRKIKTIRMPKDFVLEPKQSLTELVPIMLSEKGLHVLSCHVSGTVSGNVSGQGAMRKILPFQVTVPISMRDLKVSRIRPPDAKRNPSEDTSTATAYRIKMQMQNVSSEPLHVESVSLNLTNEKDYQVIAHGTIDDMRENARHLAVEESKTMKDNALSSLSHKQLSLYPLNVQEIRKYFFDVLPRTEKLTDTEEKSDSTHDHPLASSQKKSEIGVIEIKWISRMTEKGTLSTNMISAPALDANSPSASPLQISLVDNKAQPLKVVTERTCTLTYKFINRSDSTMNLTLYFNLQQMFPMIIDGKTVQPVKDNLEPGQSVTHQIQVVPLRAGVQFLGHGISVYDSVAGRTFYLGAAPQQQQQQQDSFTNLCLRSVMVLMPKLSLTAPTEDISILRQNEEATTRQIKPNAHGVLVESQLMTTEGGKQVESSIVTVEDEGDDVNLLASMIESNNAASVPEKEEVSESEAEQSSSEES